MVSSEDQYCYFCGETAGLRDCAACGAPGCEDHVRGSYVRPLCDNCETEEKHAREMERQTAPAGETERNDV